VKQNSDTEVQRRREIRIALRALHGQKVYWPYRHVDVSAFPMTAAREYIEDRLFQTEDPTISLFFRGMRYKAETSTYYEYGILNIERKGYLIYDGLQLGSGFDVKITYDKRVVVDGGNIGINDDYDLTPALARFFTLNHALIHSRVGGVEDLLAGYRRFWKRECGTKAEVLTYGFLSRVYDRPMGPEELAEGCIKHEHDLRIRQLLVSNEIVFRTTYERLRAVSATELATWWYIFWVCPDPLGQ